MNYTLKQLLRWGAVAVCVAIPVCLVGEIVGVFLTRSGSDWIVPLIVCVVTTLVFGVPPAFVAYHLIRRKYQSAARVVALTCTVIVWIEMGVLQRRLGLSRLMDLPMRPENDWTLAGAPLLGLIGALVGFILPFYVAKLFLYNLYAGRIEPWLFPDGVPSGPVASHGAAAH